jgi:hypothetical protein
MFLYIETHNFNRKQFKINSYEDLAPLFAMFPRTERIALRSKNLKDAAIKISKYLSTGHSHSWVEFNDLEKGLKEKAAAVGFSLATMLSPTLTQINKPEYTPSIPTPKVETKTASTDFGSHPMDSFLWTTMQIESSGGKNVKHKPAPGGGANKGQIAIGKWGLMKNTIDEVVNRMKIAGKITPEYEKLKAMNRDQAESFLKEKPQMELDLARHLADHIVRRQKGDYHRAAYAWLYGHNLYPSDIPENKLHNEPYVIKYKKYSKNSPFNIQSGRMPASVKKNQDSTEFNFSTNFQSWYKKRIDEKTKEPMRDRNFVPDTGRKRDEDLDKIKSNSQKTSEEKLKDNIKVVNKQK